MKGLCKPAKKGKMTRLNATLFAMALEEMAHGPTTRTELGERTGLSRQTILSLITALHKRRLIYVAGWERDGGGRASIQAFALGDKPNARKPPPLTSAETQRAYKERKLMRSAMHATAGASLGVSA